MHRKMRDKDLQILSTFHVAHPNVIATLRRTEAGGMLVVLVEWVEDPCEG